MEKLFQSQPNIYNNEHTVSLMFNCLDACIQFNACLSFDVLLINFLSHMLSFTVNYKFVH